MTSRGWCFTAFNLDAPPVWDEKVCKYLIHQLEECPETGKFHFQGYVELKSPMRRDGARKAIKLDAKTHMEARKGTPQQAADYCKKSKSRVEDGGPWEHGDLPEGAGARTDIQAAVKIIQDGGDLAKVAEIVPSVIVRYHRGMEKLLELKNNSNAQRDITVWLLTGAPGSGKTRWAFDKWPDIYTLASTRPEWWDGYNSERAILIDDYSEATALPYERLLRVLDRYPIRLPVKGGYRQAKFTDVVITSNTMPADWYKAQSREENNGLDALVRRISNVIYFPIE